MKGLADFQNWGAALFLLEERLMKKDEVIRLSKEQTSKAATKIKEYMEQELEMEIGGLKAGFLVDFITKNIALYYYNQGVADALSFMTEKTDDLYLLMKDEI